MVLWPSLAISVTDVVGPDAWGSARAERCRREAHNVGHRIGPSIARKYDSDKVLDTASAREPVYPHLPLLLFTWRCQKTASTKCCDMTHSNVIVSTQDRDLSSSENSHPPYILHTFHDHCSGARMFTILAKTLTAKSLTLDVETCDTTDNAMSKV